MLENNIKPFELGDGTFKDTVIASAKELILNSTMGGAIEKDWDKKMINYYESLVLFSSKEKASAFISEIVFSLITYSDTEIVLMILKILKDELLENDLEEIYKQIKVKIIQNTNNILNKIKENNMEDYWMDAFEIDFNKDEILSLFSLLPKKKQVEVGQEIFKKIDEELKAVQYLLIREDLKFELKNKLK